MGDEETEWLLRRFVGELGPVVEPVAVWAHGSLAMGDYQEGRSDLDLLAVVESAPGPRQREALSRLHRRLEAELPLAEKVHCSYLVCGELADAGRRHLTWAHREMFERPVTEVTRRELQIAGRTLYGEPPERLLPPVGDRELAEFILRDQREFWLPATTRWRRWLDDVWVDVGLFSLARATVTLRDGRMLTKGQALDILPELGASPELVRDLRERRYGTAPRPASWRWRCRRAAEARRVLREGIAALGFPSS